eukprot:snap_masked-scaffold_14-processed-gene-2.20-mRNA-1 protein AED:1.00 eAED:1.00 QI:0/-1/0/0/-1/1/1/0/60
MMKKPPSIIGKLYTSMKAKVIKKSDNTQISDTTQYQPERYHEDDNEQVSEHSVEITFRSS